MLEKLVFDHTSLPSRMLAAFLALVLVVGLATIPPYARGDAEAGAPDGQDAPALLETAEAAAPTATESAEPETATTSTPAPADTATASSANASTTAATTVETPGETANTGEGSTETASTEASQPSGDSTSQGDSHETDSNLDDDASSIAGDEASMEPGQEGILEDTGATDGDAVEEAGDEQAEDETDAELADGVALIGETPYATLAEAFAAAKAGDTIKLIADVTLDSTIGVAKNITLDVNRYTVNAGSRTAFSVTGGTFTIVDSATSGSPSVSGSYSVSYTSGGIVSSGRTIIASGATVALKGGTVISTGDCALSATNGASLSMANGYIQAQEVGMLVTNGSKAKVSGGVIRTIDNFVVGSNGSAGIGGNTITVSGGYLLGGITSAGYASCGIYIANNDEVMVSGGTIASFKGAGIVQRAGNLTITGGAILGMGDPGFVGKVGDSSIVVPTVGIFFDKKANYPGSSTTDGVEVKKGNARISGSHAAVEALLHQYDDNPFDITAGIFNSDISEYLGGNYGQDANGTVVSGSLSVGQPAAVAYNGAVQQPQLEVAFNGEALAADAYTVSYRLDGEAVEAPQAAGAYSVDVAYGGFHANTSFEITPVSLEAGELAAAPQSYTGEAIQPAKLTLTQGDETFELALDADYTIASISDNVEVGTATMTVEGKGSFTGTREVTFTIGGAALVAGMVEASPVEFFANGAVQVPEVTVALGGVTFAEGADYTLEYTDAQTGQVVSKDGIVEPGEYTVMVSPKGGGRLSGNPVPKAFRIVKRVAAIGDTVYGTLEEALEAAQDGDTVTLLDDVELASSQVLGAGITLELGSHELSYAGDDFAFIVAVGKDVKVSGGTFALSGSAKGAIQARSGSQLAVVGGTYSGSSHAMFDLQGAAASITGATVTAGQGAALLVGDGATATLGGANDFKARAGTAAAEDAAIVIAGGEATVNAGSYAGSFGLVVTEEGGSALLQGGDFTGTTAAVRSQAGAAASIAIKGGDYRAAVSAEEGTAMRVSGGTFAPKVDEAYIVDGYVEQGKADEAGVYEVVAGEAVAKIGATTYPSLQEAVEAAQPGDTIVLLSDVAVSQGVAISKAVKIDGDGHAVTAAGSTPLFALSGASASLDLVKAALAASDGALFLVDTARTARISADAETKFELAGAAVAVATGFVTADGGTRAYLPADIASHLNMTIPTAQADALASTAAYTDAAEGYAQSGGLVFEGGELLGLAAAKVGSVRYTTFEAARNAASTADDPLIELCANADASSVELQPGDVLKAKLGAFSLVPPTAAGENAIQAETDAAGVTTYSVVAAVAKVGDAVYSSLADAVAAASASDTVELLVDHELPAPLDVAKKANLDLGGHELSLAEGKGVAVTSSGKLTLSRGTLSAASDDALAASVNGGTIVLGAELAVHASGNLAVASNGGAVVVDGATVEGSLRAASGGTVKVKAGAVSAATGSALAVEGGTVAVSGGTVASNSADAPAIQVAASGTATISGGKVENTQNGAGLAVESGSASVSTGIIDGAPSLAAGDAGSIAVSGGWFLQPVPGSFCATGFLPLYETATDPSSLNETVPDALHYTVQQGTAVAQNGDKVYATLASAVAAAAEGDTVLLLADTTETEPVKPGAVSVKVNLQGYTVTAAVDGAFTAIDGTSSKLELSNGSIAATGDDAIYANGGTIVLGENLHVVAQKTAIYAANGGAVEVAGAQVESSYASGYAASAQLGGTIEVTAGGIASANSGALEVINGGVATVSGGTLSSENTARSAVVNVDDESSVFTLSGGEVRSGTAVAVAVRGGTANLSGGAVSSGTWGAVSALADGAGEPLVNITGGIIASTDAEYGYAVFAQAGQVVISGSPVVTGGKDSGVLYATETDTTTGSLAVSGGWFSSAVPAAYCATGYVPLYQPGVDALGNEVEGKEAYYTVKPGAAVALVVKDEAETVYESLEAAMAAAESGSEIILLANAAVTAGIKLGDGRALSLDLAGHGITSDLGTTFNLVKGSLEVKDTGRPEGDDAGDASAADGGVHGIQVSGEAFRVNGKSASAAEDVVLTLDEGLSVVSSGDCCVFVFGKATVNTAADLTSSGAYCTIQGNGNADSAGTVLNVTGGKVVHPDEVAIYVPQDSAITIMGDAQVAGATALYVKSGTVAVAGNPVITGTGAAAAYQYNGNGVNATGDALVVDNCGYPGGAPVVSIAGGTFTSKNGHPVGSYSKDGNEVLGGFASGGWFGEEVVSELCAEGYVPSIAQDEETGLWTVVPDLDILVKAEEAAAALEEAIASAEGASWEKVIRASRTYQLAAAAVDALEDGLAKDTYQPRLDAVKKALQSIAALDLHGQPISENGYYSGTDIGSLAVYTGLETLNLADTGITGDLGAFASLDNLKSVDLSGNEGLTDLGGIAVLDKLETLGLSNLGLDNGSFGPIVALKSLKSLDISGNPGITAFAPLTTHGAGAETCALTLEELDISGTGISDVNALWNEDAPALPALKTLTAHDLSLSSIAGAVTLAQSEGFQASGKRWDFGGSMLKGDPDGHVALIEAVFAADDATFIPPRIPVAGLASTGKVYDSFAAALAEAAATDILTLYADATDAAGVQLNGSDRKLTIDLAGNDLSLLDGAGMAAADGADLVLKGGKLLADPQEGGTAVSASGKASVTLTGELVLEVAFGTALRASAGGSIAVDEARVVSDEPALPLAVATGSGSKLAVTGSTDAADEGLQFGLAAKSSYALLVEQGATAEVSGGSIDNAEETILEREPALVVVTGKGSKLDVSGGKITIAGMANAVKVLDQGEVAITGGQVDSSMGNGVLVDGAGSKLDVSGEAEITAKETGIFVRNDASATVERGVVTSSSDRASSLSVDEKNSNSSIQVSGGWFSSPVLQAFCAPDYAPVYVAGYIPDTNSYDAEHQRLNHYTVSGAIFEVVFYDEDGATVLDEQKVGYGATPAYAGQTPVKEPDVQYRYEFSGWDPDLAPVHSDTSYRAQYEPTLRTYTVKFVDADGTTILQSGEVAYGEVPAYTGEEPQKAADAQNTYRFSGWDKELVAVKGEATYTATYSTTVNTYTITWKNEDGTVLRQDEGVAYGTTPEYQGDTPQKAADAANSYRFAGWGAVAPVTGNTTYTAQYEAVPNQYAITFLDDDGSELAQQQVAYGTTPVYSGELPAKEATAQYNYLFQGWNPTPVPVAGNATYQAVYTPSVRSYTVSFLDEDGSLLQSDTLPYGTTPDYRGATPAKRGNAQYSYEFAGWDREVSAVEGEATYTATYRSETKSYTVSFLDEDGTTLQSSELAYGSTPEYQGTTPAKAGNAQYSYTFAGWDRAIAPVTGEASYTATYNQRVNAYTVTWLDEDGSVLKSERIPYGTVAAYDGAAPVKAATSQYEYAFLGWSPEPAAVQGEAEYRAVFDEGTLRSYTVSFADDAGTVLQSSAVAYGGEPAYTGATPTKAADATHTYRFAGWTPQLSTVEGAQEYTATFDYLELAGSNTVALGPDGSAVLRASSSQPLSWTSSNSRVAVVDVNGRVTAVGAGTARITVRAANGMSLTYTVTVSDRVELATDDLRLTEGSSSRLVARVNGSAAGTGVTWQSSNPAVALVGANGTVTAVAPGTAIITATYNGITDTCRVTVTAAASPSTGMGGNGNGSTGNGDGTASGSNGNANGNTASGTENAGNGTGSDTGNGNGTTNGNGNGTGNGNGNNGNTGGNTTNGNRNGAATGGANAGNDAGGTTGDAGDQQAADDQQADQQEEAIEDDATALAPTPETPEAIEDDAVALAGGDALAASNGFALDQAFNWWPFFWLFALLGLDAACAVLLFKSREQRDGQQAPVAAPQASLA